MRVGVGWVDDLLLGVVDDSERGEAIAWAKLARPAAADGVLAADVAAGVGLASRRALDLEGARGDSAGVLVNTLATVRC